MRAFRLLWAVGLGLALFLSYPAAEAKQPPKTARVGTLSLSAGPNPNMDVFVGLRELGWVEGQNLTVESRWAAGQEDRLPALAAELVRLKVNVIVTASTPAARAAKQATSTIPIVITFVADPVGSGLVASLNRPGGNVTGVTTQARELVAKRLELLKEMVPRVKRIAVLWQLGFLGDTAMPGMREDTEAAARAAGVQTHYIEVRRLEELDIGLAAAKDSRALLVLPGPMVFELRGASWSTRRRTAYPRFTRGARPWRWAASRPTPRASPTCSDAPPSTWTRS